MVRPVSRERVAGRRAPLFAREESQNRARDLPHARQLDDGGRRSLPFTISKAILLSEMDERPPRRRWKRWDWIARGDITKQLPVDRVQDGSAKPTDPPAAVLFTVSHVISPIPNSRIVLGTDSMAPSPSRRNIEVKTTDDP